MVSNVVQLKKAKKKDEMASMFMEMDRVKESPQLKVVRNSEKKDKRMNFGRVRENTLIVLLQEKHLQIGR